MTPKNTKSASLPLETRMALVSGYDLSEETETEINGDDDYDRHCKTESYQGRFV